MKFLLFFALCAIAFGETVYPKLVPCAYHAYMNEWHDHIMLSSSHEGYLRMENTLDGSVEIIRCDQKNDRGFCKYIIRNGDDCTSTWTDPSLGDYYNMDYYFRCEDSPFEYTSGPVDVDCVTFEPIVAAVRGNLTPTSCKRYDNAETYIVLDEDNRLIHDAEGFNITYTDDAVDTSVFEVYDCPEQGSTHYPAPVDVCAPGKVVEPALTPCAYHVYLNEWEDYIMLSSSHEGYMYMKNTEENSVEIIRCDIKNKDHFCKYIIRGADGSCNSTWTDPKEGDYFDMDYLFRCEDSPFYYNKGPVYVDCPVLPAGKTAQGCVKYMNETTGEFIILDKDKRMVVDYEGYVIAFDDETFNTTKFAVTDCEEYGSKVYPAPEDVCQMKTHTLARTPCAFHSYANEYEDWNMLANATTGSLRMYNRDLHTDEIIRCDVKNEYGYCLYITLDPDRIYFEDGCNENWTNPDFGEWFDMNFMFHSYDGPFNYTKGPMEVFCPNYDRPTGAEKCFMYWNEEADTNIVVSEKNVIIRTEYGYINTYDDQEVRPIDFNVSFCNGTEIPLPVEVCNVQQFPPASPGCAFHVYVDEYEDYMMLKSPSEGYLYMKNTSSGSVEIIRCDVKDEKGHCLYITRDRPGCNEEDCCREEWTDPYYGDWYDMDYLYKCMSAPFDFTLGPYDVDCPVYGQAVRGNITAKHCVKYQYGDDYIIVDEKNRLVRNVEGWILTYTDDEVPLSIFDLSYCNGTALPAPKDVCAEPPKPKPSAASSVFSGAFLVALALLLALF